MSGALSTHDLVVESIWSLVSDLHGARRRETPRATLVASNVPLGSANRIVFRPTASGERPLPRVDREIIARSVVGELTHADRARTGSVRVDRFPRQVTVPEGHPLCATPLRGYRKVDIETPMLLARIPEGYERGDVRRVRTSAALAFFRMAVSAAFHVRPWVTRLVVPAHPSRTRLFVTEPRQGHPAASGAYTLHEGTAILSHIGVTPTYRRRGYGREMTRCLLASARREGANAAFLLATEEGLPLYASMGFAPVGPVYRTQESVLSFFDRVRWGARLREMAGEEE